MITVYTEKVTPRLKYACNVIFRSILKYEGGYKVTDDKDEVFRLTGGIVINYSNEDLPESIKIVPSGFLFQNKISAEFPGISDGMYGKVIFPTDGSEDFAYDPFAAVFYVVTRYEEYLSHEKDNHNRFKPEATFSSKQKLYDKPMAHYWAEEIKDKILLKYPMVEFPEKRFRALATIDVDNGYAYEGKGIMRTFGAYVRDLFSFRFKYAIERTHVITGNKKDPFNYYKFQRRVCNNNGIPLRYFILCSNKGEHDHAIAIPSDAFKKLVKKIRFCGKVGLHPSYGSNENTAVLQQEVKLLGKYLKKKVVNSRQHFVRLEFPETYRRLIKVGIKKDYSMGFPSRPGFRASIAEPYTWYDLEREQETSLTIFPFQVMDTQYRDYLEMNASDASEKIGEVMNEIRKVGGLFVFVWHDRSFAPWPEFKGWKDLFELVVKNSAK